MKPIKKLYFVYIITNLSRTVLYTGVTNNLRYRLYQQEFQNYGMNSFTKKYKIKYLLFYEIFENIRAAINKEKEIKGWTRAKKEALINDFNPEWKFLNDEAEELH